MMAWLRKHKLKLFITLLIIFLTVAVSATTYRIYDERKVEVEEARLKAEIAQERTISQCQIIQENRQTLQVIIEIATRPRPGDTPERIKERLVLRDELLLHTKQIECP